MNCHIHHDENDEYDNAILPCFGLKWGWLTTTDEGNILYSGIAAGDCAAFISAFSRCKTAAISSLSSRRPLHIF